ncbi:MAG: hypothetical protein M1324_03220 [Patescibacteria group bacterium]|nr:hypothetical protein [Patescibacteria group bacterium]
MENEQSEKSFFKRFWWIGLIILIVIVAGIILINKNEKETASSSKPTDSQDSAKNKVFWQQNQDGWKAVGTPPACPEPLVLSIGDISQATSVLYPGQMRSVGYEPTAGFRFDNTSNNAIQIQAPLDGEIVAASRFISSGSNQYVFDIMSPCGIMNRFDHLLEIPAKLQAIADKLPEPKENDSRSTAINPPVSISKGEIIATKIGISENNNNFLSWTVFDFRQKNKISQEQDWAVSHPGLYHFAICPYQYMTAEDQAIAKKLPPADEKSGDKSDFCNGIWP